MGCLAEKIVLFILGFNRHKLFNLFVIKLQNKFISYVRLMSNKVVTKDLQKYVYFYMDQINMKNFIKIKIIFDKFY